MRRWPSASQEDRGLPRNQPLAPWSQTPSLHNCEVVYAISALTLCDGSCTRLTHVGTLDLSAEVKVDRTQKHQAVSQNSEGTWPPSEAHVEHAHPGDSE